MLEKQYFENHEKTVNNAPFINMKWSLFFALRTIYCIASIFSDKMLIVIAKVGKPIRLYNYVH